ncbi:MAG: FAD-binding oxidoreductase [Gemmatimonadetes bacterium]|nr:FAD-binding oxidoreductase [Gemmatimonadota bacterium]
MRGEVRFDALTRGIYSTDASHYQIEPLGVVFPRSVEDVEAAMEVAREANVPLLPRGGGTSQCGQTIGRAIVLDTSRHLTGIHAEGVQRPREGRATIVVEPGVVLDHLNAHLAPEGLWFPVDPSTGSRATLGGMAGNNSAGARSIRYGMMVDNVSALEVVLPDGRRVWLGEGHEPEAALPRELQALRALFAREVDEIERRTPRTMRNVAGYNLDRLRPGAENLAQLLVGSEGTLAFFSRLRLRLSPRPVRRVLGVCHFPDLVSALDSVQHLVALEPSAVELVDQKVLRLAAANDDFRSAMAGFVQGEPGALLLVEFADEGDGVRPSKRDASHRRASPRARRSLLEERLSALDDAMADLGYPGAVVRAVTDAEQAAVWSVRKAGLNIVMSMAGPRKPISFIEDCAVPLEHLAEYATSVQEIFRRHQTSGTWYAHASVGCLHVRPALNLKDPDDVKLVRAIAEETHALVRRLGGTHSGEHGDGILRSEFLESMLGPRMVKAFEEVKRTFDPGGLMNPGKIVDPPAMDDRSLFRYPPDYAERPLPVVLDWSASGGLLEATERCNNNGACRKHQAGVMCPSFRVTHDERHSTRGRANALRLALTGQLGDDGLDSPEMAEAMSLCISCKGCRRECPAGVDMARMKLEWQHRRNQRDGVQLRERLLAGVPRLAPRLFSSKSRAALAAPLANVLGSLPGRGLVGLAGDRSFPAWSSRPWHDGELSAGAEGDGGRPDVVLFVDTFSRWFEPEIPRAAAALLKTGGYRSASLSAPGGQRPLCCGRTYLSAGMLDEAREEARRLVDAAVPFARRGIPIAGLEPSCLYTLVDEVPALVGGPDAELVGEMARALPEYLSHAGSRGPPESNGSPGAEGPPRAVLVHGHCHQKAFGGVDATLSILQRIPGADVRLIESGCCGMAGAFGYHAEHYETSVAMGELALAPAVRAADAKAILVADGTSCRAQIADLTGRRAEASVVVLARELAAKGA